LYVFVIKSSIVSSGFSVGFSSYGAKELGMQQLPHFFMPRLMVG